MWPRSAFVSQVVHCVEFGQLSFFPQVPAIGVFAG